MALLEVKNLKVDYLLRGAWWSKRKYLHAVDDVSFTVDRGETVGLVGESGCGKSSIAKALVRLENPSGGTVKIGDVDIAQLSGKALRKARKNFQMVFQDPYGSLNPRLSIQSALDEVLNLHTSLDKEARLQRMRELMTMVGLNPDTLSRYPKWLKHHQLIPKYNFLMFRNFQIFLHHIYYNRYLNPHRKYDLHHVLHHNNYK